MPSLVLIGPQMKEKQRGTMFPPAYMVPKDPSLNRVKIAFRITSLCGRVVKSSGRCHALT